MIRGIEISKSAMLAQRSRMDVVANNLANTDTKGFKKDEVVVTNFKNVLLSEIGDTAIDNSQAKPVGNFSFGIHPEVVYTSYEQGSFEETGNQSDLAIQGSGFFELQTQQGLRYTRDGAFSVNKNGYLVNADGYNIVGDKGPLLVGDQKFTIDVKGNVIINGVIKNKVKVVEFTDNKDLEKEGDNLFASKSAGSVSTQSNILQNYLENSNVEVSSEMTSMIEIQKSYEANQRVLKMMDELVGKAVNDVGRV